MSLSAGKNVIKAIITDIDGCTYRWEARIWPVRDNKILSC